MTETTLKNWYSSHQAQYMELARECGSVAELLFKIEIIGSKWTKWDWAMFLSFLDYTADDSSKGEDAPMSYLHTVPVADVVESARSLLADIYSTIDSGDELTAVFTNKTVVMNLIEWAGMRSYMSQGVYRALAHIFRRFPKLWTMNWMFVRHRGKGHAVSRTHRLAGSMTSLRRPPGYFESDAFRQDFIYRYRGGF